MPKPNREDDTQTLRDLLRKGSLLISTAAIRMSRSERYVKSLAERDPDVLCICLGSRIGDWCLRIVKAEKGA